MYVYALENIGKQQFKFEPRQQRCMQNRVQSTIRWRLYLFRQMHKGSSPCANYFPFLVVSLDRNNEKECRGRFGLDGESSEGEMGWTCFWGKRVHEAALTFEIGLCLMITTWIKRSFGEKMEDDYVGINFRGREKGLFSPVFKH